MRPPGGVDSDPFGVGQEVPARVSAALGAGFGADEFEVEIFRGFGVGDGEGELLSDGVLVDPDVADDREPHLVGVGWPGVVVGFGVLRGLLAVDFECHLRVQRGVKRDFDPVTQENDSKMTVLPIGGFDGDLGRSWLDALIAGWLEIVQDD